MDFPTDIRLHHATKAKAIRLHELIVAEYPGMTFTCDDDGEGGALFSVTAGDADDIYTGTKVPELADLLEACVELGIDPEIGPEGEEEEKPEASGSVVPETYRAKYREVSSNGQTNGDWLAETLVSETHGTDGFNVEDFTQVLSLNGVDFSGQWAKLPTSGQKGWIGRYRMNGRQVLEKQIALTGVYVDLLGHKHEVPASFLTTLRVKHEKWLAKIAKQLARERDEALKGAALVTSEGEVGTTTQTDEGPVFTPAA